MLWVSWTLLVSWTVKTSALIAQRAMGDQSKKQMTVEMSAETGHLNCPGRGGCIWHSRWMRHRDWSVGNWKWTLHPAIWSWDPRQDSCLKLGFLGNRLNWKLAWLLNCLFINKCPWLQPELGCVPPGEGVKPWVRWVSAINEIRDGTHTRVSLESTVSGPPSQGKLVALTVRPSVIYRNRGAGC